MPPEPDPVLAKLADTRRQLLGRLSDDYRRGWEAGYKEGYEAARTGEDTGAYLHPGDAGVWDYVPGPIHMTPMRYMGEVDTEE